MNEDDYFDINFDAKVRGLTLQKLNLLEVQFLLLYIFKMNVYRNIQ